MTPLVHTDRAEGIDSPDDDSFSCWVAAALRAATTTRQTPEVSLRITGTDEMADLNLRFRQKSGPTNVLSFPADLPSGIAEDWLGDIAICAPLVQIEAEQQGKTPRSHWAHLTVHGVLHLLGYDHINDQDAEAMEALEVAAMAELGFPHPYQIEPVLLPTHHPEGGLTAS